MPKRLLIKKHLSWEELEARYLECQNVRERIHWQAIWLLAMHTRSEYVSNRTRLSVQWIRQLAHRYNRDGPCALADRRHQHPGPARLLSDSQLQELKTVLEQPVPDELGGGLWNGPKLVERPQGCGLDEPAVGTPGA
jgi:transposase